MINKLKYFFTSLFYSLPIQLVLIQFRNHKYLLVLWLLLVLMVTGSFGEDFGIPYLFLEPEYLGKVSFWSMMLTGAGLGTFIASYQIAMYILDSYRFPFIVLEPRPFMTFYFNNFIIPAAFVFLYIERLFSFHVKSSGGYNQDILFIILGLLLGILLVFLVIALYFIRTNQNIVKLFGKAVVQELKRGKMILDRAKVGVRIRYRVDYYFLPFFRIEAVDKSIPSDLRQMVKVLNQNHGNALFFELILLVAIMGLGLLESNPYFQFPSSMSLLILCAILMMFFAAFAFWFRKFGVVALLILLAGYFVVDYSGFFEQRHPAYGMGYQVAPAQYNSERLDLLASEENIFNDSLETIMILNQVKSDYELYHEKGIKPRFLILCASGGGLRSSYFSFRCLQLLDSVTKGELMNHTILMAGASGGMVGSAYYRELYLRDKLGEGKGNRNGKEYQERVSRDVLNRIMFKIVSGMFLPGMKEIVGDESYFSDRGYSFDEQLQDNLPELRDRRLIDYQPYEESAVIPMMILNPLIINDGRRLFMSPVGTSYLTRNRSVQGNLGTGVTGIEFKRFFKDQEADSILFMTVLRMNSSFPMITPYVQLPSEPKLETIDAGIIDNFGIQTALKFLYVFRKWFAENTDGVMLVQMRDSEKDVIDAEFEESTIIGQLLNPIGRGYTSYSLSRDLSNEDFLNYSAGWFENELKLVNLEYFAVGEKLDRASLNWHLTPQEKAHIEKAFVDPRNQKRFQQIKTWVRH